MSCLDDLLAELCPDGVRHLTLLSPEVAHFSTGKQLNRETLSSHGKYEVFNGGIGSSGWHSEYNTDGPAIIVSQGGASAGFVNFISNRFWAGAHCYVVTPGPAIDRRFLYHVLKSKQAIIQSTARGAGIPGLARGALGATIVPVPPLEVQREIVRVLEHFARLEAELEAELEARRRQYEHYAGVLLESDDDVPRVKFGDVATIVRGASPRPIQNFVTDGDDGVPWIKIGDVPALGKYITRTAQRVTPEGAAKSRRVKPGDFVLSNSMSFGRPYISKIDGYIHDGWLAISEFEESFVSDYLYYLLRATPVQEEFARRAGAGTVKNLNAAIVRSIEIPLPTKERQEQVVELLDKFDALVNDISIGLPAELAVRRKQYEYYRDLLLTFEETVA